MSLGRWITPTSVWAVLVLATLLSAWLGIEEAGARVAVVFIMAITLLKVRLVFLHFMELSSMTGPWRWIFEAWALGCMLMILMLALHR